jgi:hypothetical protein
MTIYAKLVLVTNRTPPAADARSRPARALAIISKVTASEARFLAAQPRRRGAYSTGTQGAGSLTASARQRFGRLDAHDRAIHFNASS